MVPGQVHSWHFEGEVDGYIVHFNEVLFTSFLQNNHYLQQFYFFQGKAETSEEWINERMVARQAARQRKDFKAADDIRKELLEQGIMLEDKGGKTTWRRK